MGSQEVGAALLKKTPVFGGLTEEECTMLAPVFKTRLLQKRWFRAWPTNWPVDSCRLSRGWPLIFKSW